MIKVIIAGGRNFADFNKLCQVCDKFLKDQNKLEIVSGAYKGADILGERYAAERNHRIKQFPADWKRYGKSAGYKRNAEMAAYANALIAFWDGKSKGTKNMIDLAKQAGLKVRIYNYKAAIQ
jgi:glycerophosphoryl diester phosphodiesterase